MNAQFLTYLIESSICLMFFLVVYRLTISKLTHFSWMRGYLLLSLLLSAILPIVTVPVQWSKSIIGQSLSNGTYRFNALNTYNIDNLNTAAESIQADTFAYPWKFLLVALFVLYVIGGIYKSIMICSNLNKIYFIIKKNEKHREGVYWLVNTDIKLPAFSFFNFIFINKDFKNLSNEDIMRIKNHEIIHAKQWHTLDILFVELLSVIFWFNPLVRYTKVKLQEIHEFIADEQTAGQGEMKKNYAQLLFSLATDNISFNLMTGFSSKQICNRILMVSKRRSIRWSKLMCISLIPVAIILLLSFSYLDYSSANAYSDKKINKNEGPNLVKVRNVKWVNNTIFTIAELNNALGLKKGDEYVRENMKPKWNIYTDRITGLYSTKNYLFTDIRILETPINSIEVDLTVTISEGKLGKFGTIQITGNKKVSTAEIESKLTFKSGDQFSVIKMLESEKAIGTISKLDPHIIPLMAPQKYDPKDEYITVNVGFQVNEK